MFGRLGLQPFFCSSFLYGTKICRLAIPVPASHACCPAEFCDPSALSPLFFRVTASAGWDGRDAVFALTVLRSASLSRTQVSYLGLEGSRGLLLSHGEESRPYIHLQGLLKLLLTKNWLKSDELICHIPKVIPVCGDCGCSYHLHGMSQS